jgi:hypothetical protein
LHRLGNSIGTAANANTDADADADPMPPIMRIIIIIARPINERKDIAIE